MACHLRTRGPDNNSAIGGRVLLLGRNRQWHWEQANRSLPLTTPRLRRRSRKIHRAYRCRAREFCQARLLHDFLCRGQHVTGNFRCQLSDDLSISRHSVATLCTSWCAIARCNLWFGRDLQISRRISDPLWHTDCFPHRMTIITPTLDAAEASTRFGENFSTSAEPVCPDSASRCTSTAGPRFIHPVPENLPHTRSVEREQCFKI